MSARVNSVLSRVRILEKTASFVGRSMVEPGTVIRAVVFDLDGLMFDTEALFCRVSTQALAARGKAFTRETMQSLIGRRADEARAIWTALAGTR